MLDIGARQLPGNVKTRLFVLGMLDQLVDKQR